MITTSSEYTSWLLNQALHPNKKIFSKEAIIIPFDEPILDIDLDSREIRNSINGSIVNITLDHQAEIIFFRINRYYQTIDLAKENVAGFIIYQAADGRVVAYQIPTYYTDQEDDNKILFPWVLTNSVTAAAGSVRFAVTFIGYDIDEEDSDIKTINFRLNTLVSSLTITENSLVSSQIDGFEILSAEGQEQYFAPTAIEDIGEYIIDLQNAINEIAENNPRRTQVFWIDTT